VLSIVKRDVLNLLVNPALNLYGTLFPVLLITAMGVLNQSMFATDIISSYDYYTVTLLVFIMFNMAVISTNSFMEVSIKQANLRIGYAPIKRYQIYGSKIMATFLFSLLSMGIALVFMRVIFSVNFGIDVLWLVLVLSAGSLFASSLGVMTVILLKHEESANQLLGIILIVFALMGGVFFSPYAIGETFGNLSVVSPFRWVIESAFLALYDECYQVLFKTVGVLVLLSGLCLMVCQKCFKLEAYL